MSDIAQLVSMFVRATEATRVLEVGTGQGNAAQAIAEALPAEGMLISIERDASAAAAARQRLASLRLSTTTSVMVGDAKRYLHKIAGPFDIILNDGDVTEYEALHERLVGLLAPHGMLVTHNTNSARRYNEVLARDRRLATVSFNLGDGVAVSVKGSHS
jgi:caffeoyl-CoA O-methyltransferase